jgi:hypothetical protein
MSCAAADGPSVASDAAVVAGEGRAVAVDTGDGDSVAASCSTAVIACAMNAREPTRNRIAKTITSSRETAD